METMLIRICDIRLIITDLFPEIRASRAVYINILGRLRQRIPKEGPNLVCCDYGF
jgi:hypothetical protein